MSPRLPALSTLPLVAALLTAGCVHGRDIEALGEQISAIQAESAHRDEAVAAMAERLEVAEAELEAARARIEALEAERDELATALDDTRARAERMQWRVSRLERGHRTWRDHTTGRLVRVERHLGLASPASPESSDAPVPGDLLPSDLPTDPAEHAAIAREHLSRGENDVARAILSHALDLVGDGAPAAELRYLLGMTWFQEQRWGQAATAFQLVTEAHADSEWAAWSLVRQGECFREMGDVATARVFLEEIVERFPDTDAAADAERLLSDLPPTAL